MGLRPLAFVLAVGLRPLAIPAVGLVLDLCEADQERVSHPAQARRQVSGHAQPYTGTRDSLCFSYNWVLTYHDQTAGHHVRDEERAGAQEAEDR